MSITTTLTLAAVATGLGFSDAALAASHGDDRGHEESAERALVILTSDSLQTQGMAMGLFRHDGMPIVIGDRVAGDK